MGYADGYYYGQGRIICDTSTFSVGDTIRVRSMTDSSKVWNQQVATVGTALVFTVPCYDYYKICTVQNNAEIGGVYKTVDYGQTLFINVLDKTTLGGIQGILNAHQEANQLSIGDEVTIKANGADWIMQIAGINVYNSHDIMFTSKHIWTNVTGDSKYSVSNARVLAQTFYNGIDSNNKQYIKQVTRKCREDNGTITPYDDYCFILGNKETVNVSAFGVISDQVQMPLFVTQINRIKTYNGTTSNWWTADHYNSTYGAIYVDTSGEGHAAPYASNYGVVPSFMLIADS